MSNKQNDVQRLDAALDEFLDSIAKALHLYQILDFINEKLKNKEGTRN